MTLPSVTVNGFEIFMHPNAGCKCCHPQQHASHPSVDCACCQVEWERTDRSLTLQAFIESKLRSALANAPTKKSTASAATATPSDLNFAVMNQHHNASTEAMLFCGEPVAHIAGNTMAELLVEAGIFSSRGQARKAGWTGDVPPGFSELRVGKRRVQI